MSTPTSDAPWRVGLISTWSELTGHHVSIDSCLRELSTLRRADLVEWTGTLLHIVSDRFGQSRKIQRELVDVCLDADVAKRALELIDQGGRNVVFHRRQLWLLLQFVCVVCGETGTPLTSLKGAFGRLCLIASDSLSSIQRVQVSTDVDEKKRLEWQMALLISVAETMLDDDCLGRAQSLWFDSITAPEVQKELALCGVHDGLDAVFLNRVGLTLTDAFFALVTIYKYLSARTKDRPITPIVMTLQDDWWGPVPLDHRSRLFTLLSVPVDTFAAHLFGTPRQSWATDFSPVMARPFIESKQGHFICPDLSYLRAFFLDGIFLLFQEALPGKEWGNAFGAMYEWYIRQLVHAALQRRPDTQSMYFDKVKFKGKNDQVCDVLLLSNDTAALFESKGTRLTTRQKSGVSVEETTKAVTDQVGSNKAGAGQLANNIIRILGGETVVRGEDVLDAAKPHIIPILVWYEESGGNGATQTFLDEIFVKRLKDANIDPSRVGPLLLFSTSELELFEQCSHYVSPDFLLKQFAEFVLAHPGDARCTFLRYAFSAFEGKQIVPGFARHALERVIENAKAQYARGAQPNGGDS